MAFLWFCAAGYSFYCGSLLLAIVISLSLFIKRFRLALFIRAAAAVSVILIFLSAPVQARFFYITWLVLLSVWFVFFNWNRFSKLLLFKVLSCTAVLATLSAFAAEARFYFKPTLPEQQHEKLYIIGDSVTAGIGGYKEQTWPKLLRNKYAIEVMDLSVAGATVSSALKQAQSVPSQEGLVFIEIGGNDLLNNTAVKEFRRDIEKMLQQVSSKNHTVVMMELPILPWQVSYARAQRQIAEKFDVILIPKRFFVRVLSSNGASTDLAHLTSYGHRLMGEQVWLIIGPIMKTPAR